MIIFFIGVICVIFVFRVIIMIVCCFVAFLWLSFSMANVLLKFCQARFWFFRDYQQWPCYQSFSLANFQS